MPVESAPVSRLSIPVFVLLLVAAVLLAVRYSPLGEGPDALDDQIVDYVYDTMLPPWAATVVDECNLPSRAIKGLLQVKTKGGAIALTRWKWVEEPPNWGDAAKRCFEARLVGRSSTPPATRLGVPEGREYEVDLDLTIPPSTTLQ